MSATGAYTLDRMAYTPPAKHALGMRPSAVLTASARPPDNELYDRGCDLVEAAAALRRLARDPGATASAPAVLGCIETALHDLGHACDALEKTTERALLPRSRRDARMAAVVERMRRGFANLRRALQDAEATASAARSLAARSLGA